jgi:hypothetical protein
MPVVCRADFVALAEDDRRELIDGEVLEIDMPTILPAFSAK